MSAPTANKLRVNTDQKLLTVDLTWSDSTLILCPNLMEDFLDKFFDLCKEYQQEIPPHKIAEILREYEDRLDE